MFFLRLEYDVCPYATFSLPSQTASHKVTLRSFNQHDCYENASIMDGHHSIPKRPKMSNLKCSPDDFNLGKYIGMCFVFFSKFLMRSNLSENFGVN